MNPPDAAFDTLTQTRVDAQNRLSAMVLDLVSLPLLLLAWVGMTPLNPALGPIRAAAVVLLVLPSILVWSTAPPPRGPGFRIAAVLCATGALLAARPTVFLLAPSLWLVIVIVAGSALLLVPAAEEWRARLTSFPRRSIMARLVFDLAFAAVLPLAIFFATPIQRFPPPAWVDSGIYLGLTLDYLDVVRVYGWNYYALRVSYIIPNVIANAFLPPVEARLAVMVGFHLLSTIGLYTGARMLWGRLAAMIAAVLLASNPVFLLAVTAGYVDGAVVAYSFLLFAALAAWRHQGSLGWLVAAGAFSTLAVLAHVMAAVPILLFLGFFAILEWPCLAARPFYVLGAAFFGAALAWLYFVYSLASLGFGVSAFYVMTWIVQASVGGIGANYRLPLGDWLPATTRLVPAILTLFILATPLAAAAVRGGRCALRRLDLATLLLASGTVAFLPAYDVIFQGSVTQSASYASLVLPGTTVISAAAAALLLPPGSRFRTVITVTVTLVALVPLVLTHWFWRLPAKWPIGFDSLLAGSLALALLTFATRRAGPVARILVLLGVILLTGLAYVRNADTRVAFRPPGTVDNAEFFGASIFVRNALVREGAGRVPLFWFDRAAFRDLQGQMGQFTRPIRFDGRVLTLTPFDGLASLRLWDRALFAPEIASGSSFDRTLIFRQPESTLIVLDNGEGGIERAVRILGKERIACRVRYVGVYQAQSFLLRIAMLDVLGESPAPAVRCG